MYVYFKVIFQTNPMLLGNSFIPSGKPSPGHGNGNCSLTSIDDISSVRKRIFEWRCVLHYNRFNSNSPSDVNIYELSQETNWQVHLSVCPSLSFFQFLLHNFSDLTLCIGCIFEERTIHFVEQGKDKVPIFKHLLEIILYSLNRNYLSFHTLCPIILNTAFA